MSQPFIEHVIEHYLARDKYRLAMTEYQSTRSNIIRVPSPGHYVQNGWHMSGATLNLHAVHLTRESLKRSKKATVEHIHMLLHKDDMLDEFVHLHQDGDIFHFVIHEVEDLPDLGDLL